MERKPAQIVQKSRTPFEQRPEYARFKERLHIDRHDLDTDIEGQQELVQEVGEEFAYATSRRDEIEHNLEQVQADLTKQFRANFEKKDTKPTDKAIAAEVEGSEKVRRLKVDLLDAKFEVAMWNTLRASVDARGSMLKIEAQLYAAGYFSRKNVEGARSDYDESEANRVRQVRSALAPMEMPGKGW